MVTVVQLHPQNSAAALGPLAEGLAAAEQALLGRALEFAEPMYAGQVLSTGEPTWSHALGLAASLASIGLDAPGRAAGILFAAPKHLGGVDALRERFGEEIAGLAAGVEKLYQLRVATRGNPHEQNEVLRKMVLGMVEDVRAAEAHLLHLDHDAQQVARLLRGARRARRAHHRAVGEGLLYRARRGAQPVAADPEGVRRLHLAAEGKPLPVAAHRGGRPGRQDARSADPHRGDAPTGGVRRRRALALQRAGQAFPARRRLRAEDRLAARAAGVARRDRRLGEERQSYR